MHVQSLSGAASGTTIGTPIIQIYGATRRAGLFASPQAAATPDRLPVRREFIYASYALAVVIAAATILKGGRRQHPGRSTMIGRSIRLAACVCLLAWLFGPMSVQAVTPTSLTMDMDSTITVGAPDRDGAPDPAGPVPVRPCRSSSTGDRRCESSLIQGRGDDRAGADLEAGDYEIQAVFRGTADLVASASSAVTSLIPATFTVRTVPAIAGLPSSGGPRRQTLSTAADGTIRIPIRRSAGTSWKSSCLQRNQMPAHVRSMG